MSCHGGSSKQEVRALSALKIALAGNPNVGKSAIFNRLTGGRAWVGNWPGVTVEKRVGRLRHRGMELEVVDLPGIYSLTTYSVDEVVARNFILKEKPAVVVQIVNAVNLERNLYLTLQLLEMGARVVIALNMIDLAESSGIEIDVKGLEDALKTPVVPTVAVKGRGISELIERVVEAASSSCPSFRINYGEAVETALEKLEKAVKSDDALTSTFNSRWVAVRLLEGDEELEKTLKDMGRGDVVRKAEELRRELGRKLGGSVEDWMVEKRYRFILSISRRYVKRGSERPTLSEQVDKFITHPFFGPLILLSVLYAVFRLAFDAAAPLTEIIDWIFSDYLYGLITSFSLPPILSSLLADGLIAGVGFILVFIPNIALLFMALAILEDIGYLSRIAFLADKVMNKLGLSGKTIIPLMLGFGCNVPAIMATRTLEDERDRKTVALMVPLMSCSARLPVYLVFALAFFRAHQALVVISMYLIGVGLAAFTGFTLKHTFFQSPLTGFVMEMPPYLAPSPRNVLIKTWERTKRFLVNAGTIILLGALAVWILITTGPDGYLGPEALHDPELTSASWIALAGKFLEPVFSPMGWDWRAAASLIFGFVAKEVVVSSMGVIYGAGEEGLTAVLSQVFTPLSAFAFMAFTLIYVPCLATVATLRSELGVKYALIAVAYELILAYLVALTITVIGGVIT